MNKRCTGASCFCIASGTSRTFNYENGIVLNADEFQAAAKALDGFQ
jgi:hypothetical protein